MKFRTLYSSGRENAECPVAIISFNGRLLPLKGQRWSGLVVPSSVSVVRKTWVPVPFPQLGTTYLWSLSPNFLMCKIRATESNSAAVRIL